MAFTFTSRNARPLNKIKEIALNAPQEQIITLAAASIALAPGEEYAGLAMVDGKPSHHLILLPGDVSKKWGAAKGWAKEQGGDLPTSSEQSLLFAHLKGSFKQDWYWSSEPYADVADYAWGQYFTNGYQDGSSVSGNFRARAVRRVSI